MYYFRVGVQWGIITFIREIVWFTVLKADQSGILKFPMSPLSCSLGSPLGSALLSGAPGLHGGSASHHLPLDLHLRSKLEHGGDGNSKTKKGRRSRTVFTELQLMGLEKRFEKQKYLSTPDRYLNKLNHSINLFIPRGLLLLWVKVTRKLVRHTTQHNNIGLQSVISLSKTDDTNARYWHQCNIYLTFLDIDSNVV